MSQQTFHKRVEPLPPSAISYLRTRFRCGLAEAVASPKVAPAQALLLFSLAYGAGAVPEELAKMRVDLLLDADGHPASHVRFDDTVTKHRSSRKTPMHADVRNDLVAFQHLFPGQRWIAFRADAPGSRRSEHLPASSLVTWFRECLRQAGLRHVSLSSARKAFLVSQRSQA